MDRLPIVAAVACALALPASAEASCFCMFRPMDEHTPLAEDPKNPATSVFLLRDGTRTVLTVEPVYEGPPVPVSMVVPLPSPIARDDVRTIGGHHFRRVDQATAPRAHHQWEDCPSFGRMARSRRARGRSGGGGYSGPSELGVVVEEEWEVDEYDVSLLSAAQSSGLLTFLRDRGLALPDRADAVLRSYIETGHRFAFIEADPSRARVVGGRMVLPALQLHYDSEQLVVPVRLGTLNSPGEQELVLYVLSRDGRYEVANREALVAPSGASLRPDYEGGFAAFYRGLMDELFARHPGATVTEYAASFHGFRRQANARHVWWFGLDRHVRMNEHGYPSTRDLAGWTLTRIRHRYGRELDDDLVLRPAPPLDAQRGRWARGFVTQFEVMHPGSCPGFRTRRAQAQSWATASALWEQSDTPWPGEVILDPVLGIEPGSRRPAPPPDAPVAFAEEPTPSPPEPAPAPAPPAAPPPVRAASCAAAPGDGSPSALLLVLLALLVGRRARSRAR